MNKKLKALIATGLLLGMVPTSVLAASPSEIRQSAETRTLASAEKLTNRSKNNELSQVQEEASDPNKMLSSGVTLGEAKKSIEHQIKLNEKLGFTSDESKELLQQMARDMGTNLEELEDVELESKSNLKQEDKKTIEAAYEIIWLNKNYSSIKAFNEGMAPVNLDEKWGFIDKKGKEVIYPKYDEVGEFKDGLGAVRLGEKWGFIDKTGKLVVSLKYDSSHYAGDYNYHFSEGLANVGIRGKNIFSMKFGFIDKLGKVIIPIKYDYVAPFKEGLATVKLKEKYGYIDKKDKVVIDLKYDYAEPFSEGLAQVTLKSKRGYIDKTGKVIIPLIYDYTEPFSEGLAVVKSKGKYGFVDKTGKVVIPLKYDNVMSFKNGLASVKLNGKYGYIDKTGKVVIPLKYDLADSFEGEFAKIGTIVYHKDADVENDTLPITKYEYQYINKNGDIVSGRKEYNFVEGLSFNLINGKWSVIDKNIDEMLASKLDYIGIFNIKDGVIIVKEGKKYGFLKRLYDMSDCQIAESIELKSAKSKIQHLTQSLKNNYLGIKNQATWEIYIKQAKDLIAKIPSNERVQRDALAAEVARDEGLVKAVARINHVEKSIAPKSQGGYGNYLGIKNAETWNEYLRIATEYLEKVDKKEFQKQYNELIARRDKVQAVVDKLEAEFKVEYDRVVKMFNEAKAENNKEKAKIALQEAEKLGTCPRSDSLEKEIKEFIGKDTLPDEGSSKPSNDNPFENGWIDTGGGSTTYDPNAELTD